MRMMAVVVGALVSVAAMGPVAASSDVVAPTPGTTSPTTGTMSPTPTPTPEMTVDPTSAYLAAEGDAAMTIATLSMPASARDKAEVTVSAEWRRLVGGGVTGRLQVQLKRTGTTAWVSVGAVDVVDGVGSAVLTPRDDGRFRLRWAGSPDIAAVSSPTVAFDNVPYKNVHLRVAQYNLPGPDKLPRSTTRARRAAVEVKRLDPDVLVLNELVGPGRNATTNRPSRFARSLMKALGDQWAVVTPTMAYNENYVVYRPDRVSLVAHYPDRVVPGTGKKGTGRHVTPVLLKDLGSNQPFLLVGTHLVSGDEKGARRQARSVGSHAAALSSGYPVVVAGDMNTATPLTGLTDVGLKDARLAASSHVNAAYATYTSYAKKVPSRDARRILDRIYVPQAWTVRRWTTALDTRGGRFVQPRASDHSLIAASMAGPPPAG